ncbi:MAG: 4-hydroxyphenylpyruvate dioxygenase [Bacteroidota bacterium]
MEANTEFLPLNGTDYVEFFVGNAKQSAHYYQTAFGFQPLAYAGLETGLTDRTSYVLQQGKIRLVLTTALGPDSEIAEHVKQHGDGVKFIALWVDDARKAYEETVKRGAKPYLEPTVMTDAKGEVVKSGIHTYGETIHLFIERKNYQGLFLPGFIQWNPAYRPEPVGLMYVDHIVGNLDWGQMNVWAKFYEDVMGFKQIISFDDNDISTDYTALMSKVMSNGNGYIKFPLNEPAKGKSKSQIEEYIEFYKGAGVQHVAMITNDIAHTITELKRRGVEFLEVPDSYYDTVLDRVGTIKEDLEVMKKLNILIDCDDEGYLLQLFTKPVEDRPTVFYEIIQRQGAKSFGKGNFKALFESIEREQGRRGTL